MNPSSPVASTRQLLPSSRSRKKTCSIKLLLGSVVVLLAIFFIGLQYKLLHSTNGNSGKSNALNKRRRPKILVVHIGKTGGEFIKAQLAVVCKTRKNKLVKADCLKRFQTSGTQSLLSTQTMGYLHVHNPVFPKNGLQASTHYLFSVRHPLSRFLSWCKYKHGQMKEWICTSHLSDPYLTHFRFRIIYRRLQSSSKLRSSRTKQPCVQDEWMEDCLL